jgi:hypothetical protein
MIYLAIFAAGAYIVYVAIAGLTGGASLGGGAVAVEARVTGARTVTRRGRDETYEVQYAFDVGKQTYTYRDPTGRTNLWVPLTREAWDAARAKGTTPVRYLPSDPLDEPRRARRRRSDRKQRHRRRSGRDPDAARDTVARWARQAPGRADSLSRATSLRECRWAGPRVAVLR